MRLIGVVYLSFLLGLIFFQTNAQAIRQTTDLSSARVFHQAVGLPDGKVLVIGGFRADPPLFQPERLSSCEIFDPATETWSPAGTLNDARSEFAAVLTHDNKVLAIGGVGSSSTLSSVESYDPATNTWTQVGNLPLPTKDCYAILLDNNSVLLVGGRNSSFMTGPSDGSGTWTEHTMPNLIGVPSLPRAIRLSNGKILVAGGSSAINNQVITISQSLVVDTGANPLTDVHPYPGLALLSDGKVLINGGNAAGTSEVYDPVSNSISLTGNNFLSRFGSELMPLTNGKVASVTIGNSLSQNGDREPLEIFDPSTQQWQVVAGHFFYATQHHRVTPVGQGKYLISGGSYHLEPINQGTKRCYIFDESLTTSTNQRDEAIKTGRFFFDKTANKLVIQDFFNQSGNQFSISVYDLTGRVLQTTPLLSGQVSVSVSLNGTGFYLAVLSDSDGNFIRSLKFVYQ